jgi:hypothetical protein
MRPVGEENGIPLVAPAAAGSKAPMAPQRGQRGISVAHRPATGGTEGLSPARAARNLSSRKFIPMRFIGHDKGIEPIIFGQ